MTYDSSLAISFASGLLIGSAVTYILVKDKYRKQAEEEIADAKEFYEQSINRKKRMKKIEAINDILDEEPEQIENLRKESRKRAKEIIDDMNYDTQAETEVTTRLVPAKKKDIPKGPYQISADDFLQLNNFDKITLLYFRDDVLINEEGDTLNIDEIVGRNNIDEFVDSDENVMYVSNEKRQTDYEILKQVESYLEHDFPWLDREE